LTHDELEELREFLLEHVSTFEELEALLFLARSRGTARELGEVASALQLSEDLAQAALAGISGKFLSRQSRGGGHATYEYAPRADLEPRVEQLRRAYREERFTIVQIMSDNALKRVRSSAARQLAEAFRLERTKK